MDSEYDVLILGMGPAGLAAAARLQGTGLKYAIVDSGKAVTERDRYSPKDATSGDGGAGLYSDGKFSFYPSATALWSLPRESSLKAAYKWTCDSLNASGLDTPPFPDNPDAYSVAGPGVESWMLKSYPSDYLSLESRLKLVEGLVDSIDGAVFRKYVVEETQYDLTTDSFMVRLKHAARGTFISLNPKRLIVASGRFGPLDSILKSLTKCYDFRRLEVGFRIQQSSGKAFFRDMRNLDPKLRIKEEDDSVQWLTFCVCRQGETCVTQTNGLWTVSGRSDCPPTGLSNSGFNTRIHDEELAERVTEPLLEALGSADACFKISAKGLLAGDAAAVEKLDRVYGTELRMKMTDGLRRLSSAFKDLSEDTDTQLIGPTLEGVGWYPEVDGNLRLLDSPVWVAGDACGLFRGIVAAMISGHYAADSAVEDLVVRSSTSKVAPL